MIRAARAEDAAELVALAPDVMLAGGPRLSGFRVVIPELEKSSVTCITFDGPLGSEVLWSRGASCG